MRVGATSWRKLNHPTKRFGQLPKRSKSRIYPIPHSKPDNSVAIDDAEIAECLADSIETQCSRFLRTTSLISVASRKRFSKTSLEPKDDLAPVSLSEVQTLVKSFNTRKAPGLGASPPLSRVCLEGFETERSTVAVFFDVAKAFDRQTDISHLGMSALTRQDVLSEQEFLKAPPSLLCCTRVHKRYTATVVVWRPTRVIRGRYRALYGSRNRAPDSPSSLQRAIDELGQWFRKWRIEVNPDKSAAIQFKLWDLELPTISKYMKDASKRFFDIAGSHPNALLRAGIPPNLSVGHETYLPIHLTLLQRQFKALMTSTTRMTDLD
ncbi:hypothetical protein EVAR_79942_1 [Eumeta japonica]|uniref:Uncharacterized protein n=1 Tax=Eumeta variegata TaxID=151549 RepID=A0A4C1Y592_EUMVA|nr:hypothetical protein EVAR_79942_1 [Eumeta japonica]